MSVEYIFITIRQVAAQTRPTLTRALPMLLLHARKLYAELFGVL